MIVRIGHGYDAHRFQAGRKLVLGGVTIPHESGLAAHSDGDVVIHAICNALLGAVALGDIGKHFPDSCQDYSNIDSRILLQRVMMMLSDLEFKVSNVDATVVAQAPKLAPYIAKMCANLAEDMNVKQNQVSVKATTTEEMGFIGRKEGIAAHAVALLIKQRQEA